MFPPTTDLEVIVKAAVVSSFDAPPRYTEFPAPAATDDHSMVVDMVAAGLHPRVRSQANGSHYTSTDELPLIPGVDGVGRGPDGALRYFILEDTTRGTMAEQAVIDTRRSIVLPEGSDAHAVAAALNPAMSLWLALRKRVQLPERARVLVLGATGNAGRMAVQISKLFGARQIVGAGRDADRLAGLRALGATDTVSLGEDPETVARRLGETAAGVDVVLDYLWGEPAAAAMAAIITRRPDRSTPLSWVEIGSVAGPTAPIPSAALRAARLQIVGSGQGSISTAEILAELPALAERITAGAFDIGVRAVPLADVERVWTEPAAPDRRIVLVP